MIQHLCDRCKQVIDPKTGLIVPHYKKPEETEPFKLYNDGTSTWKHSVYVKHCQSDLCRECICAVIMGHPFVEAATDIK